MSHKAAAERRAYRSLTFGALLLGGVAIAFSPIFVRVAEVGPMASAFWRVALAAPFLAAWSLWDRQKSEAGAARLAPIAAAGVCFACDLAFWHLSIVYTSVANATLLSNFAPLFVTLGAWLLYRQRVTRSFLLAMAVAIAGAALLAGPNFSRGGTQFAGDMFGIVTAVFYGSYMLAIWRARNTGATSRIMAMSTSITAVLLLPVALAFEPTLLPATSRGWLMLIGLALVCQVAGQSLIAYAMAHLPASLSALSLLIQPVCAAAYAWILLGESISAMQFAGGAIVLAGIYLARRSS
ncbi:MAG: DMT family transporter [Betaproteobacteria bacterium]|nr:DMT family transporter [Betaproteobacteria bacterium]MBI2962077.1 DMT family transporter [Betaproteobacteria bacterium]